MQATRSKALTLVVAFAAALALACAASTRAVGPAPTAARERPPVDLVIQGAVDAEVMPIVASLTGAARIQIAAWTFWRGRLGGREVVVSRTEVGPINAVAATTLAIGTFHPRLIVNQGTAGATDPGLHVFDIVVGEATVDYGAFRAEHADAAQGSDQTAWTPMFHRFRLDGRTPVAHKVFPGDAAALAFALAQPYAYGRVVRGVIGSAFQFNQEVDRLRWIHEKYGAVSEDMESAYAAGAALGFGTPFIAIRVISDSDFDAPGIRPEAAGYCATFVARFAGSLPVSVNSHPQ